MWDDRLPQDGKHRSRIESITGQWELDSQVWKGHHFGLRDADTHITLRERYWSCGSAKWVCWFLIVDQWEVWGFDYFVAWNWENVEV